MCERLISSVEECCIYGWVNGAGIGPVELVVVNVWEYVFGSWVWWRVVLNGKCVCV